MAKPSRIHGEPGKSLSFEVANSVANFGQFSPASETQPTKQSAVNTDILFHPFTLGFGLGLLLAAFLLYRLVSTKAELKRYRRHLSDKLELEADLMKKVKNEKDSLLKENENLRIKVASLNDLPDRRVQRDLEIFARAEKLMLVSVPGFAPAWEKAKHDARSDVEAEEAGRSMPKRVFARIFGGAKREDATSPAKMLQDSDGPEM